MDWALPHEIRDGIFYFRENDLRNNIHLKTATMKKEPEVAELKTVNVTAQIYNVPASLLHRMIRKRKLKALKVGAQHFISDDDIKDLLECIARERKRLARGYYTCAQACEHAGITRGQLSKLIARGSVSWAFGFYDLSSMYINKASLRRYLEMREKKIKARSGGISGPSKASRPGKESDEVFRRTNPDNQLTG